MQEFKEPKSAGKIGEGKKSTGDAAAGGKQQDTATSSETLKDIDKNEKSGTGSSETGSSSSTPSPDGQFDGTRGGGGGDPAGPM